jgi:hypothetical protein
MWIYHFLILGKQCALLLNYYSSDNENQSIDDKVKTILNG